MRANWSNDVGVTIVVSRHLPCGDGDLLKVLIEEMTRLPPFHQFETHLVNPHEAELHRTHGGKPVRFCQVEE